MIRENKRERGIKVSDENSDEELRVTAKEKK